MTNRTNLYLIILLFTLPFQGISQKYSEGKINFGLISIEDPSGSLDSSMLAMLRNNIERETNMTIYFTEDVISMVKEVYTGDTIRGVFDLKQKKYYEFKEVGNEPSFTLDNMNDEEAKLEGRANDMFSKLEEGNKLSEKIFGLECTEYVMSENGASMVLTTTNDIESFEMLNLTPMSKDMGCVVKMSVTDPRGITMIIGMKSFTPRIENPEIFSVDTTGLVNQTKYRDAMVSTFRQIAEEEQTNMDKYGEYEGRGENRDLLKSLVDNGVIDQDNWEVTGVLEDEPTSIDIPSILLMVNRGDEGLINLSRSEMLEVFKEYDMLSPSLEKLLTIYESEWNKISDDNKYRAICLAAIKDHLTRKSTREQIVANLEAMEYGNFDGNRIVNEYIEGNVGVDEILGELDIFKELDEGIALSDDDIYEKVVSFFNVAFEDSDVEVKVAREDNLILVNDGTITHTLELNSFKEEDYENSDYSVSPQVIAYFDTTEVNSDFYGNMINVVKQIGADNQTNMAYHIFQLNPTFTNEIETYDYYDIIESIPFLKMDNEGVYFQQFIKEDYDGMTGVGTSFPFHPDADEKEILLGYLKRGGIDAGIDYLTTDVKMNFIDFLTKYQVELEISKDQLEQTANGLSSQLIAETDELMSYLPNMKITVSKIFDVTPRSQYRPSFSEGRNDFKDAYASIHSVIKGDFQATDFTYDEENHKVHFMYNGEKHVIDPGDNNMINFIRKNMKSTKSGKQLYSVNMFSVTERQFYYMKPEVKDSLGKLMSLNF